MKASYDNLMDKYFAEELNDRETEQFNEELNSNRKFREEVEFLERLNSALIREDKFELKQKLDIIHQTIDKKGKKKSPIIFLRNRNVFLIAALMVVFFAVGYLAINYSQRNSGLQMEYLADNFSTSPLYESLIESSMRSASFEVLSPENGTVFTPRNKITFEWQTDYNDGITLLLLQYVDQSDEILYQLEADASTNSLKMKDKLKSGRYYWRVETEGEILHVGWFLVE